METGAPGILRNISVNTTSSLIAENVFVVVNIIMMVRWRPIIESIFGEYFEAKLWVVIVCIWVVWSRSSSVACGEKEKYVSERHLRLA